MKKIIATLFIAVSCTTAFGTANAKGMRLICTPTDISCMDKLELGRGSVNVGALEKTGPIYQPPITIPPSSSTLPAPPPPRLPEIDISMGGYGYDDGISCSEGRKIVRQHGYKRVRAVDCNGDEFQYHAFKRGVGFQVTVNMDGDIVDSASDIGD